MLLNPKNSDDVYVEVSCPMSKLVPPTLKNLTNMLSHPVLFPHPSRSFLQICVSVKYPPKPYLGRLPSDPQVS